MYDWCTGYWNGSFDHGSKTKEKTELTNRRSMTSCSMNRMRDDVFLSFMIFSSWLKYWSIRG